MCVSVVNWMKILFFKTLCAFPYFMHKKVQNSDKIRFIDDLIFYNSDFIISKYKAKSRNEWLISQ